MLVLYPPYNGIFLNLPLPGALDDYSRFILYARLVRKESSWAHIRALEAVCLRYGLAASYYVDSHSIFRFVQGRDSFYRKSTTALQMR